MRHLIIPLILLWSTTAVGAGERWFNVLSVQHGLLGKTTPRRLTGREVTTIFDGRGRLRPDWARRLPPASATAIKPPWRLIPFRDHKTGKVDNTPVALVSRFSKSRIEVLIVTPLGFYRWHHYYRRLHQLMIRRTPSVNAQFGLQKLDREYAWRFRGLGYNDDTGKVHRALGKPDKVRQTQVVGYFFYHYKRFGFRIEFVSFHLRRFIHDSK